MIQLDNVKRQFGTQILFENLSWMIPERARLGLVGPNGVGKTTLLRMLAGLESPDEGTLHRPRDLEVGYLPQEVESIGDGSVLSTVLSGFPKLADAERRLEELAARLAGLTAADPEAARLTARYGELHHEFEALGGHELEARAKVILSGLGIPVARFHESVRQLSGGWRMRVVLARLLLGSPALLLLDEPTNHLDLEATVWLEDFLESYVGAFLVVSHDRYFLNRMVRGVVELSRGALTQYSGNYDAYVEEQALREAQLQKAAKRQAKEIARVERFIERFRYKNTKSRQVQSRVRALEKTERIQTAADEKRIHFGFPPAPRSGDIVVRAEGLCKTYPAKPGVAGGDKVVYDGMDLLLRRGDRVALVGPNGTGKSTLMKLLVGATEPSGGLLELGHNVNLHYYAQHQLEALDPGLTVLEEVSRVAGPADRPRLRKLLGGFLFGTHDVEKKIAVLSGGEKARVALAKMLIQPANLLLLDEPTNHLDLRSSEVLEDALNAYEGTLIVISHDRYFINRVVTAIAEVGDGKIALHEGDYDEFTAWKARRKADPGPEAAPSEGPSGPDPGARDDADSAKRRTKREEAEERNRLYRERKAAEARLGPLEAEIAQLEATVRECEAQQADPRIYSDAERAREIGRDKAAAEARLTALYAEWEAAAGDA